MLQRNKVLRLKEGVDSQGVHPLIWVYATAIGALHLETTGHRMVITSMARMPQMTAGPSSYHNPRYASNQHFWFQPLACAFDMRRWYFNGGFPELERFCLKVKSLLDIGCLIEPEWMSSTQIARRGGVDKIAPHVHWQLSTRNTMWLSTEGQLIIRP
jgi:hypothetical protein